LAAPSSVVGGKATSNSSSSSSVGGNGEGMLAYYVREAAEVRI
jgi:hypothetical protein